MNKDDVVDGGDTCSRCPELLPWDALYLDNGERLCNHCEDRANKTPRSIAARLVEWADDAGADGMAGTATLCREAADALTTLSAENEKLRAKVADLEGALQPFAYALETHEEVGRPYADDDRINIVQAYGCLLAELDESHFYQARQALAGDDHGHR